MSIAVFAATPPWHSRAHHKYRATAGYLAFVVGKDLEFAHCEFTDHHDAVQLHHADELRFHHNLVDNFNDDGIEVGPKKERGRAFIYQNVITRCLNPFTLHGNTPIPVTAEPGSGYYIYRNIIDLRDGTYFGPPAESDPSGKFLNAPTVMIAHDHGAPSGRSPMFIKTRSWRRTTSGAATMPSLGGLTCGYHAPRVQ